MISARNPYKKILEDLIGMLNKDILGERIRIIPCNFDYEQSGSDTYARLLITNNDFQNSHTGLEIHNIVAKILDAVGQNNNIPPKSITLRQLLLGKGVRSIENTFDSERIGKYVCIVPHDRYNSIQSDINSIFTNIEGGWREKCYDKYKAYPLVGRDQKMYEYAAQNQQFILDSIRETVAYNGLPKKTNVATLLNNNTARNLTTLIKKTRKKNQPTI